MTSHKVVDNGFITEADIVYNHVVGYIVISQCYII